MEVFVCSELNSACIGASEINQDFFCTGHEYLGAKEFWTNHLNSKTFFYFHKDPWTIKEFPTRCQPIFT